MTEENKQKDTDDAPAACAPYKAYGQSIQSFRKARKMKQKDLADRLHVSVSAVQKYESGMRQPTSAGMVKIAVCLGVPVSEIFSEDPLVRQVVAETTGKHRGVRHDA